MKNFQLKCLRCGSEYIKVWPIEIFDPSLTHTKYWFSCCCKICGNYEEDENI
jgi:hypothetical protein